MLGPNDTVARFGGDTFGVLLPDTDADAALAFAERIQLSSSRRSTSTAGRGSSA